MWSLSPELSLPAWGRGLHAEEVLFFALAAAMCQGGLTLALWAAHGFSPRMRVLGVEVALAGGEEAGVRERVRECDGENKGKDAAVAADAADASARAAALDPAALDDDPFPLAITKARRSRMGRRRR